MHSFFLRTLFFSDVTHSLKQRLNLVQSFNEILYILRNYYGNPHIQDWIDMPNSEGPYHL